MGTEYNPRPWPALLTALADRIRQGTVVTGDHLLVLDAVAEIERLNNTLLNRRNRMIELEEKLDEAQSRDLEAT